MKRIEDTFAYQMGRARKAWRRVFLVFLVEIRRAWRAAKEMEKRMRKFRGIAKGKSGWLEDGTCGLCQGAGEIVAWPGTDPKKIERCWHCKGKCKKGATDERS